MSNLCPHGYPKHWCDICKIKEEIKEAMRRASSEHYFSSLMKEEGELWADDLIRKGGFHAN